LILEEELSRDVHAGGVDDIRQLDHDVHTTALACIYEPRG
jgi:hypothetical protein